MPSDDELRRVAEDVRALARSLSKDIRAAFDRGRPEGYGPSEPSPGRMSAREDLTAAGRAARDEFRKAERALRQAARDHRHRRWDAEGMDRVGMDGVVQPPFGSTDPPRWDNWGNQRNHRHREPPCSPVHARASKDRRQDRHDKKAAVVVAPALPVRHRHDGTTLFGLLALVFGLAWLASGTHLASVSTEAVLAVALMVVGATVVVTARTDWALSGRAWPVVAGILAVGALLVISASPGFPAGFHPLPIGARTMTPQTWSAVPAVIHGGIGHTVIDLSGLPAPLTAAKSLTIDNAAGALDIYLPDVPVHLIAHVDAGTILVQGGATSGIGRSTSQTLNGSASGRPLTLTIQAGFGKVAVSQGQSPLPGSVSTPTTAGIAAPLP